MTEAYPLYWPEHRPRTARREASRFGVSMARARDGIVHEVRLMGGRDMIISSNVSLRGDGLPYAQQRRIDDPGIAVYFERKGQSICFACDRWDSVADNMRAIEKTIQALRGIARWGTGDMMEAAFRGFEALPAPGVSNWRDILGRDIASLIEAESMYRELARVRHPDTTTGSDAMMADLNTAIEQAREHFGIDS